MRTTRRIAAALLTGIYRRQAAYVFGHVITPGDAGATFHAEGESSEVECLIVESAAALDDCQMEIPAVFRDSADTLKSRLDQGCIVILAYLPGAKAPDKHIVGYSLRQRGVFSALGRQRNISADILFTHYVEVLPEYRGQRLASRLTGAALEYCRKNGLTRLCSVVMTHNQPSIQYTLRVGFAIIGTVERVSILKGLFVWETPWQHIERALSDLGG
jgi:GNAT superfamily N-acetyltransferase